MTALVVGYFLVDKVNARAQSELVKTALQRTADHGIKIRNITYDEAAVNVSMLAMLGCYLDTVNPITIFKHPYFEHQVHATLDTFHMLQLALNALAEIAIVILQMQFLLKVSLITLTNRAYSVNIML